MSLEPSPKVNSKTLREFSINKLVRVIGKVVKVEDKILTLEASDHGQITVHLKTTQPSQILSSYVEVTGRIKEDHVLNELALTNLGEWMNFELVEAIIRIQKRNPEGFGLE